MVELGPMQRRVLSVLSDGTPKSRRQIVEESGISDKSVENALARLWEKDLILRTVKPIRERNRVFKGRSGIRSNLRSYHPYVLGKESVELQGFRFVKFDKKYLDKRGSKESKAKMILEFLEENKDRAFYSKNIVEALKAKGVKPYDVMSNIRRFEKKGLVYVRGYRTHENETPFKEGYLLTWIESGKPREQALEEAIERTNEALAERSSMNPVVERVHIIRDQIIEATKLNDLISFDFIQNKLNCSKHEAERAQNRTLQLYPDLKEIKLFNAYRYFYHTSLSDEDLKAAIVLKENYIRKVKGRANRIGHNWEACVEWFIDTFTTGAVFQTQAHRTNEMDPRRITLYLIKSVVGRRQNAEVDRVWSVTPGVFSQPITYVLECKWGLIRKDDVDDFLNVLRWSKEFGVDTPDGRQVKQGIIGVFAGGAFNPKENVLLKDEWISLASYAGRLNIQLLKASDFNQKLRERGSAKFVTVQRICKLVRDEKEVRDTLEVIWQNPEKSEEILTRVAERNKGVFEFEKMLEQKVDD